MIEIEFNLDTRKAEASLDRLIEKLDQVICRLGILKARTILE